MHPPNVAWLIIVVTDRKARARRRVELAWFKALSDHCALIFIIVGTTGVESGGVLVARGTNSHIMLCLVHIPSRTTFFPSSNTLCLLRLGILHHEVDQLIPARLGGMRRGRIFAKQAIQHRCSSAAFGL